MVEDRQYLQLIDAIGQDLENALVNYNKKANGQFGKDELIALRLEQNAILAEMVHRHRRFLDYVCGKPVEPEIHFGEAILVGIGTQS